MKRKLTAAALIALMLLLPVYREIDDGGSKEYAALLYRVTLRHTMTRQEGTDGYLKGTEVRIFGITVYDDVCFMPSGRE
jgi:hypothetical protein